MLYFLHFAGKKKLPAGARRGVLFGEGVLECEFGGLGCGLRAGDELDELVYG